MAYFLAAVQDGGALERFTDQASTLSKVFDAGAEGELMPVMQGYSEVLSDYVNGVYTAGRWVHELKRDFPALRDDWQSLVTRTVVWTRQGASRRIMVKVPTKAQDLVAQAAGGLQRNLTTVAAARDFVALYRSRRTQAERTLLLDFLCEASTMYCSSVGSAARFRMSAELYRVWSARHLQVDRSDPAAEGAPPGSVRRSSFLCVEVDGRFLGDGWPPVSFASQDEELSSSG